MVTTGDRRASPHGGRRLRVAFVGKGGAGKSSVAGILARLLAAAGEPVLVVDSDPLPGLAYAIGLASSDAGLPAEAIEERREGEDGPRFRLRAGLTAEQAVDRYAATGPDGVRVLQFGKVGGEGGDLFASQLAFRHIVRHLPTDRWHVIGDLPGGTRQPFFGWGAYARIVVIVAEPSPASILSARRLTRLARLHDPPRLVAVASKVRDDEDVDHIRERTGLPILGSVPHDDDVVNAERRGVAPIDHAPDSPAVHALRSLLDRLLEEEDDR